MIGSRGSVPVLLLILISSAVATYLVVRGSRGTHSSQQRTSQALAYAKQVLIGDALVDGSGYLRLPDIGSSRNPLAPQEGRAAGNFAGNALNTSVLGRLPWRTLATGVLRDAQGECLWYGVSGSFQRANQATPLNWDSLGHFDLMASNATAAGTLSTALTPHQRPVAVLIAPGPTLAGQNRGLSALDDVTQCGGNYDARNYLDPVNPDPRLNNVLNYFDGANNATGNFLIAPKSLLSAPATDPIDHVMLTNDQMLGITSEELFQHLQKTPEFKANVDGLLRDLSEHLNGLAPALLPARSAGNKGLDGVIASFIAAHPENAWNATKSLVRDNWRNNLLYTRPAQASVVNGAQVCAAVLLFAGARTQRSVAPIGAQLRASGEQIGTAVLFGDPTMYLEGGNTVFPAAGAYAGAAHFDATNASADVVRCITGLPAGAVQESFNGNLPNFIGTGSGLSSDTVNQTVTIQNNSGVAAACLWSPTIVPLAGKVWRSYHEFRFARTDAFATGQSSADRGYGMTLQWVSADPGSPPHFCGPNTAMGSLDATTAWGNHSIILETDVHRDAAAHDPNENHTAILLNGQLDHALAGNSLSDHCIGASSGCRHTPANLFEESPTRTHRERVEIHSGCNADCGDCDPTNHAAPNDYARISVWIDCLNCDQVGHDLNRSAQTPSIQRCFQLAPELTTAYYGFTGGFLSGTRQQSVTISNFFMRSE